MVHSTYKDEYGITLADSYVVSAVCLGDIRNIMGNLNCIASLVDNHSMNGDTMNLRADAQKIRNQVDALRRVLKNMEEL